jgi:hypothetical protein
MFGNQNTHQNENYRGLQINNHDDPLNSQDGNGSGIWSSLREATKYMKPNNMVIQARKAINMASGNPLARDPYPGEKHAILIGDNSLPVNANAMGPGSSMDRLRRNDMPVTFSDGVSMVHDNDYRKSKTDADILRADNRYIKKLKYAKKNKLDSNYNINLGLRPIQAKKFIESRLGHRKLFSKQEGNKLSASDRQLIDESNRKLIQQGYGPEPKKRKKKPKMSPIDKMKLDTLKKISKQKGKGAMKGGVKPFSKVTYGKRPEMSGRGILDKLATLTTDKIIPSLMKEAHKKGFKIKPMAFSVQKKLKQLLSIELKKMKDFENIGSKVTNIVLPVLEQIFKKKLSKNKGKFLKEINKIYSMYIKSGGKMTGGLRLGTWDDFLDGFKTGTKIGTDILQTALPFVL